MNLSRKNTESEHARQQPEQSRGPFSKRLKRALGPILPGLLLDTVDFFTFGPIGIYLGIFIGCPLGYWICSQYKLSFNKRLLGALAAGIYCTLPFTGFAPVATLIGVFARFFESPESSD
jgi:hypothetical protein